MFLFYLSVIFSYTVYFVYNVCKFERCLLLKYVYLLKIKSKKSITLIPLRRFNHATYLRLIQTMILIIISFTLLSCLFLKYDVYKRSGSLYRGWLLIIYVSDEETNTLHTLMIYGSNQKKNASIVVKREYEGYQRSEPLLSWLVILSAIAV